MVTDRQVRLLRKKRMEEKTLEAAAVAAGMSERTTRTWQHGPLPSATTTSRSWRTRPDPFVDVWAAKIEPLLVADSDGKLEAKTIFEELCRLQPDAFEPGQLRTLQRRVRVWRAERGPEKEIFFPQLHTAGKMGAIDFTHATELSVIIGGLPFVHLFFELVLAFSGWRFVQLAFGETFEALLGGVQAALWALGGVPETIRLDNLSAATHELARTGGRSLTKRFADVVEHYGFKASRIRPGEGHENGVVEQGHHRLKSALDQALRLRGSREFGTVPEYLTFVQRIVDVQLNGGREEKLALDRAALRRLPAVRLPEYTRITARVRKWSTVTAAKHIYSVPSRLTGHLVELRVHANVIEVRVGDKTVETMPRVRGEAGHRIDYRHVIWSLVRKPGAFAAYRFREDLFPSLTFRRAYDALRDARGDRADVEYVRILHLAASTSERSVETALATLLETGTKFDYAALKALAHPDEPTIPTVSIGKLDFECYDEMLVMGARR